jgi:hypothetical protein
MRETLPVVVRDAIKLLEQGKYKQCLEGIIGNKIQLAHPILFVVEGACYSKLGEPRAALVSYRCALEHPNNHAIIFNNMGNIHRQLSEYDHALRCFERALEIQPNVAAFHSNYGNCCLDFAKVEKAKKAFDAAISLDASSISALRGRAKCFQALSDFDAALVDYFKILEVEPGNKEAIEALVYIFSISRIEHKNGNTIIDINNALNSISLSVDLFETPHFGGLEDLLRHCSVVSSGLPINFEIQASQLYKFNSTDLNCRRHKAIFDTENIIPQFCFNCYKVQVDLASIFDCIKLYIYFSQLELPLSNCRKTMVELRDDIPGFYKGLIYCQVLDDANMIRDRLSQDLPLILTHKYRVAVKHGCSEYPVAFPMYSNINAEGLFDFEYPASWNHIEVKFDTAVRSSPFILRTESIIDFNIYDFLVMRNWVNYGVGAGDLEALELQKYFGGNDVFIELGRQRSMRYGGLMS